MNTNRALLQREWLQHRRAWALMLLVPLVIAVVLVSATNFDFDISINDRKAKLPDVVVLTVATMVLSAIVMFLLAAAGGLTFALGLVRRDHADRSIEFWLSLPIGHARSLLVPLLVHLVALPMVAAAVGLLMGLLLSAILVGRIHDLATWLALPWGDLFRTGVMALARLWVGWPLALLWLSPLLMVGMLTAAWLRRWGLVALALLLSLAPTGLGRFLGLGWLGTAVEATVLGALTAVVNGQQQAQSWLGNESQKVDTLRGATAWVVGDTLGALRDLASLQFLGGLTLAAGLFMALVHWRRQGFNAFS
jgi:ABC-2 type transport system permease protein